LAGLVAGGRRARRALAALLVASGAALARADPPSYALSFLPDEQENLICLNRGDAVALLRDFRDVHVRTDAEAEAVIRRFESEMGPGGRYDDCGFVVSVYVPRIPLDVIDLETEGDTAGWGGKPERFFVRATLLVDGEEFTAARSGDGIWAFTWDFVITKD
jgi:hypothetical protein